MTTLITAKFSIDAYHKMIAAGVLEDRHVELLNGEIIEMPSEGAPHAGFSSEIGEYLRDLLGKRARVRNGNPITIPGSNSEPQPDIAIVRQMGSVYFSRHPYPEEVFWLIEVSDTSLEKDLDPKAKLYAAAGIQEYWVVNVQEKTLVIHQNPSPTRYRFIDERDSGNIYPLAFPDVAVSIEQIIQVPMQGSPWAP